MRKYVFIAIGLLIILLLMYGLSNLVSLKREQENMIHAIENGGEEPQPMGKREKNFSGLSDRSLAILKKKGLSEPERILWEELDQPSNIEEWWSQEDSQVQFPDSSQVQVLNERWVKAFYQEGDRSGEVLLEYSISKDGSIDWKVLSKVEW